MKGLLTITARFPTFFIILLIVTDIFLSAYIITSRFSVNPISRVLGAADMSEKITKEVKSLPVSLKTITPKKEKEEIGSASGNAQSAKKSTLGVTSSRDMSGFVRKNGRNLTLNGSTFRSVGVNRYNLLTLGGNPYVGCAGVFPDGDLEAWFSEAEAMGVTSLRFWVFQSFTKNGTDFTRFDQILRLSEQHGIKVIPVLENQWGDCTEGGYKGDDWYRDGYKNPYGSYTHSYREHVTQVVHAYKNNTTIMLWQLMNEAETDHQALYGFTEDMGGLVKSLDTNHLVSLGTIGNGQRGAEATQYRVLHGIPSIDVIEYHDYHYEQMAFPDYDNFNSLKVRFSDSMTLDKPIIMGESGIKANCTEDACFAASERAQLFGAKMEAFFSRGGAAYLLWSYRDHTGSPTDSFDFSLTDPLSEIVTSQAAKL